MILVSHVIRGDIKNVSADVRPALAHQKTVSKFPVVLRLNPSLVDCDEVQEALGEGLGHLEQEKHLGVLGQ